MSDVNTFIETIGKDIDTVVVPKVQTLAQTVSARTFEVYGPRVAEFVNQLAKDIIDEQSGAVRDFVTSAIEDLFRRYQPELKGELHARMVAGAVEVTGHGVSLDVKRRDTGASVSSLDIPVSLRIKVDDLAVRLQNTTIRLDVVR
jgi:hypothetical protein